MSFFFDSARWDQARWSGEQPGAGWGQDWSVWYQVGSTVGADLTDLTVEMRWTTDSRTMGDGTFRGDIQPGHAAIRFWDPGHQLDHLDKMGAVWARYNPTGATWCWFYDSLTRGLYAPGDPTDADLVFNGDTWPARMTTGLQSTVHGVASVSAALNTVVSNLNASTLNLPAVAASIATQNQMTATPAAIQTAPMVLYPGYLDLVRQAASDGVAWLSAARPGAAGTLTLNYARWETAAQRALDRSQVVAGPAVTQSFAWAITQAGFAAVKGDTAAQSSIWSASPQVGIYGYSGPLTMRLWGDLTSAGPGPEYNAAQQTCINMWNARGNPNTAYLSTVNLQSGPRFTAGGGGPSSTPWNPNAHVWAPTEILAYTNPDSSVTLYRVCHADHILNAASWQTTLTLETYIAPSALP